MFPGFGVDDWLTRNMLWCKTLDLASRFHAWKRFTTQNGTNPWRRGTYGIRRNLDSGEGSCFTSQPSAGCGPNKEEARHSSGLFSNRLVCNLYNVDIHGLHHRHARSSLLSLSFGDHCIRIADDGLPGCTFHFGLFMHY